MGISTQSRRHRCLVSMLVIAAFASLLPHTANAQLPFFRGEEGVDLSQKQVEQSIQSAVQFLVREQKDDGKWSVTEGARTTGVTALTVMALVNCELKADHPAVAKGLKYLMEVELPNQTYEVSLMIMALAAANDPGRTLGRVNELVKLLEKGQILRGTNAGTWDYSIHEGSVGNGGDRSNGQFAILGLRDAVRMGVKVKPEVWDRAYKHWEQSQNGDGSWGYSARRSTGYGSMTVAGIASVTIINRMRAQGDDENADGSPTCCSQQAVDPLVEKGIKWMESVTLDFVINPRSGNWLLYYLYGLERAGRLTGRRFFGKWDWYREGAQFLIDNQPIGGYWKGKGSMENDPVVGTSLALLFLSKGLAPVLINKLQYGAVNPFTRELLSNDWNNHPHDARNISEWLSTRPQWPQLMTSQAVNIKRLTEADGPELLRQAPMLLITGKDKLALTTREARLLRKYVDEGGFIFAVRNCGSAAFDDSFRAFVEDKMYPDDAKLRKLLPGHPVYRSEFLLDPKKTELWGVDFGCRTPIIYCPDDLSCAWDKWLPFDPPKRSAKLKDHVQSALETGANVIAYATGREPPGKLAGLAKVEDGGKQDKFDAGFLRIAKLRHNGGWDTAPRSVENLLKSLNERTGILTSTKRKDFAPTDDNIFQYPILYMHGRSSFQLSDEEREQIKTYLTRGGVLFADSCCGAKPFDQSFRVLMKQLYPEAAMGRIPMDHELFSTDVGFDIRQVRRRGLQAEVEDATLETNVTKVEPFLEGIKIDGRYAVIYSKYDISCAMERQSNVACSGYISEDAFRIAINVVRYTMLQELVTPKTVPK